MLGRVMFVMCSYQIESDGTTIFAITGNKLIVQVFYYFHVLFGIPYAGKPSFIQIADAIIGIADMRLTQPDTPAVIYEGVGADVDRGAVGRLRIKTCAVILRRIVGDVA